VRDEVIEAVTSTAAVHQRCRCFVKPERDPEKWKPVFPQRICSTKYETEEGNPVFGHGDA
jgi:hypothetical protein